MYIYVCTYVYMDRYTDVYANDGHGRGGALIERKQARKEKPKERKNSTRKEIRKDRQKTNPENKSWVAPGVTWIRG